MSLIDILVEENWLKTPAIKSAFLKIKREDFLPDNVKNLAEVNEALPIGSSQTISQPAVVAFMLEQLQPKKGEKVLDIGSGSGWTSGILAEIVGSKGKVFSLEIVPELKEFGEQNLSKYGFLDLPAGRQEKRIVETFLADGSKGFPNISSRPELAEGFDRILVSASSTEIPNEWKEQLKVGGRIVAPVGNSIKTILKKSETDFEEIDHPGFVFVPLISK